MKKVLAVFLLLSFSIFSIAQQLPEVKSNKISDDLFSKSKKQKTIGQVMLIGGVAAFSIGFVTFMRNGLGGNEDGALVGVNVTAIGILSMVGSIPFFVVSAKNKRLAHDASVGFRFEKNMNGTNGMMQAKVYPAIGIQYTIK